MFGNIPVVKDLLIKSYIGTDFFSNILKNFCYVLSGPAPLLLSRISMMMSFDSPGVVGERKNVSPFGSFR